MSDTFEKLAKYTEADNPKYKGHPVFLDLDNFIAFYDSLSMSVMSFSTTGTKAIINIDTYVYSSIQGTLESINMTLKSGRLGDAFSLLRKYHDSIILNLYTNLYLEKNRSQEKFIVEEITDWLSGKKKLPNDNYGSMSSYIEKSEELKDLFLAIYKDESYKQTRQSCNDHMHYNYFDNVLINDNMVHNPKRIELLDLFSNDLENLFILHLCSIFYLNDHYMCSSDYIDALEVGMNPEPDSQYWVASFIQDIFSELITLKRPDLARMIKDKTFMHLS
jgi:hypothetical protein